MPLGATSAGAAATSARLSTLKSSSYFGAATGGSFTPDKGEPLRSTAMESYLIAFSITGSTYFSMPSLFSKSCTAGIIFERLYIFEKTLING